MVRYRIQKGQPPAIILSQINPVQAFLSCFSNIHFNINSSTTPICFSDAFQSSFSNKSMYAPLLNPYVLRAQPISLLLISSLE